MRRFLTGCLAALAVSGAWSAEILASFSDAGSDLSAAVRLEARTNATVAARVVTGTAPIVSSDGVSSSMWDTTQVANGWHEVTDAADAQKRVPPVELLVVNEPDYQVEGGRIEKSMVWSPDKVHWVRNWVVVPNNVVLTVLAGTVVKFGENTGIKVEAGGEVEFAGKDEARVVLTHFADDDFGGDSDFGVTNASYGAWSVTAVEGGTIKHIYTKMRYGTMQDTATVSLPASVTAQRIEGKVRIPVTFSGSRTSRFSLHWRTTDGTAKFGTDYLLNEGETAWFNADDGKGYFEIPLVTESADTDVKTFLIDLYATEDANPNTSQLRTTVTIVTGTVCPVAVCAESELSPTARLEARDETTTGHALVRGMEMKSPTPDALSEPWDTTKEPEGWNTLTVEDGSTNRSVKVLVRNASDIAFEGGRLSENVVWSNKETHIVRNWVVVPQNTRLLIAAGTVVKFAEHTGIRVEDGGTLQIDGKNDARCVLTALADDTFGGDTDCLETNAVFGTWGITTVGSGVVNDLYTHIRYGAPSTLPTISMPATVTCQRSEGKARIPVTFSGTRTSRFSIHWRAVEESAKKDEDFLQGEGEVAWFSTEGGAGAFEIPINTMTEAASNRTFTVEIFSAEDINVDTSRYATKVTIVTGSALPVATCAESEQSNLVRLEARETNTLGRAAVVGTEWKAKDDDSRAEAWDTTPLGYGWQTLEDGRGTNAQVLALNDAKIAVEGGRLTMNATWESNVVHVVRNTVVVPSGITLTVLTNAVVKFCENTGVKVEAGGSLIVIGSKDEPAIFTPLADDTTGGDTDKRETPVQDGQYAISVISGGTFSDSNAAFRHVVISSHATLSLPTKCEINESEQQVQIPISLSGSRTTPFRAFWRVIDGTAKYPDDFPTRTGVVEWNSSSDGTRYITVPVNDDGVEEETESFTVELYEAQGANISVSACSCVVTVRDSTATAVPLATCAESELSAAVRLENRPEGYVGKAVVCGVEQRAANGDCRANEWDTTKEPEGWQTLTSEGDGEGAVATQAAVLVRNDEKIAVEGGRLTASTVWNSNTVHLVRNTVVVPSGVTLSVTTNAVVKFCENTGVKVEAGGRFQLLGSLDENVYMTLANDDTVGGDTDKDEEREWVEGAATYSINVVSGGTFTDMNSAIRGTTVGSFGYASVNAKTVVDATEGKVRIPVFVNGSRSTQFSVDWKTSDGLTGRIVWGAASEGTKWVTLNVADCSEKFTFELCECRGINIDGAAKASEVTVFNNATPLAVCAESELSAAVRLENRADGTFGKALCFGTEWKSADSESRAEAWDTTKEDDGWQGDLLVLNDASVAVEGGRVVESSIWSNDVVHVVRNWVVVPNGVTLTIAAGTVVKFAELTGFKVEAGGRLNVEGTVDAPVVYTAAADDTIGGDTDKREVEPQYGDYSVNIVSGGTYSDKNCAIRYATFSNFGTATLPATAVANEKDGVVRVPMFISTSRTTAFCVDWRVASGTYATRGRLNWNTYTEGTKYIEIPLTTGTVNGEFDTFEIEMYESQGINVSTTERKCTVKVYPDNRITMAACAESNASEPARLENRDPLWSYGAEIVCGTEWKSANGESRAEAWDTTQENEGWVEVTDGTDKIQLLVRNDEGLSIEGGRLAETTTWSKDKVHIVRNWVVVPNGVTLTIAAGTIVKFCDETGIKVEAGGRLVSAGTSAADVILTSINDDTVGGDTDFDEVEAEHGGYRINVISGGTFTDTYTQMRYGESGTFGSASAPAKVVAKKDGGIVRIPITISTSRATPFSVDWIAHDGKAVYGEDYLCASGRVEWTSSSQGTRYIEIPLDRLSPTAEDEWFEVELITGLGINLNLNSTLCEVELYDTKDALVGDNEGYAESAWASVSELDGFAGTTNPMFAQPLEKIRYSTFWFETAGNDATAEVTIEDSAGNVTRLVKTDSACEGFAEWVVPEGAFGRYHLKHIVRDVEGGQLEVQSQDFIVSDIVEHGGVISVDEIWDAGHVHVVRENVVVRKRAMLTIEPGAIVKFFPGTGIVAEEDARCIAFGAQFTHVADDQLGGDTLFDGGKTVPTLGEFTIAGNVETDVSTEIRFAVAKEISSDITEDTTWGSHTVYHVTKSIAVRSPATLTILPGAVVKLADRSRLAVNSGATLDARGTRAAPVIFTSIRDDNFGGDSNGDGAATKPTNGIWDEIANYGVMNLTCANVYFGGYGQYSNQGDAAVRCYGGVLTMNGCLVRGSELRLLGQSGGTFTVYNSILQDGRWGWEGNLTFVNGIVDDCTTGAGGGKIANSVICNCVTAASGASVTNCLAWQCDGGVASCLIGDPGFVDYPNGDYRIGKDSPCVDAADNAYAPVLDFYGQTRNAMPDIGIFEVQVRNVKSDVDLFAVDVSGEATATVGGNLKVSWTVENQGTVALSENWRDVFELVDANGSTIRLGSFTVTGGIPAGGRKVFSANFCVPSVSAGEARLRLKVNGERDVFEGSATANNIAYAEKPIEIRIPSFTDDDYSTLTLAAGSSTALNLSKESGVTALIIRGGDGVSAYGAIGYVPHALRNDVTAVRLGDGSLLLTLPVTAGEGDFNFVISNGGGGNETVMIETVTESLEVAEVSPHRIPNKGDGYLTLRGVALDTVASVRLVGGMTYAATALDVVSSAELALTFALNGASPGTYALEAESKIGEVVRIEDAVEIYKPLSGPKLEARLEVPNTVRQGRIYTGKIIYSNTGDTEMYAPFLSVKSVDAPIRLNEADEFVSDSIGVIGISRNYPAGILLPGCREEIQFEFKSGSSPRFTLYVEDDPSSTWSRRLPALSAAATTLNGRGRTVFDYCTLLDFAELCSSGGLHNAICGNFMFTDGSSSEGVVLCAIDAEGETCSIDAVDANGRFVLDGLAGDACYQVTVFSGAKIDPVSVVMPPSGDFTGLNLTAVKPRTLELSIGGIPEGEILDGVVKVHTLDGSLLSQSRLSDVLTFTYSSTCQWEIVCIEAELSSGRKIYDSAMVSPYDTQLGMKVSVDFSKATMISGVVRDSFGKPLASGNVRLRNVDWSETVCVPISSNGEYVIGGVLPDTYMMDVEALGFVFGSTTVVLSEDADIVCDFQMPETTTATVELSVPVVQPYGQLFMKSVSGGPASVFVVSNASTQIKGVPLGTYECYLLDANGMLVSDVVKKEFAADELLTLTGRTKVSASVQIQDEQNNGVKGTVRLSDAKGAPLVLATDDSGRLSFTASSGYYWMTVTASNKEPKSCYVDLTRDSTFSVSLSNEIGAGEVIEREGDSADAAKEIDVNGTMTTSHSAILSFISEEKQTLYSACLNAPAGAYKLESVPDDYAFVWYVDDNSGVGVLTKRKAFEQSGCLVAVDEGALSTCVVTAYADASHSIPLPGVTITFMGSKSNALSRVTDSTGKAVFSLTPDEYVVSTEKQYVGQGMEVVVQLEECANKELECEFQTADESNNGDWLVRIDNPLLSFARLSSAKNRLQWIDKSDVKHFGETSASLGEMLIPRAVLEDIQKMKKEIETYSSEASMFMGRSEPTLRCSHNMAIWKEYNIARMEFNFAMSNVQYDMELMMLALDRFYLTALYLLPNYLPYGFAYAFGTTLVEVAQGLFDNAYDNLAETKNKAIEEELSRQIKSLQAEKAENMQAMREMGGNARNVRLQKELYDSPGTRKYVTEFIARYNRLLARNNEISKQLTNLENQLKSLKRLGRVFTYKQLYDDFKDLFKIAEDFERYRSSLRSNISKLKSAYARLEQAWGKQYHDPCDKDEPRKKPVDKENGGEISPYVPPSFDPNEMAGPIGLGDMRFVKPGYEATYTVYFENSPTAEAAAMDIYVTNPLSPWLDWSSFKMGDIVFANQVDHGLNGVQNGMSEVRQNGTTYYVDSSVAFSDKTGVIKVELHIADKTTKYGVPDDPYAGVLQPNDETGRGEGYFNYKVKFRDDIPAGTIVSNSASIVFDYNAPIETDPAWWNTVAKVLTVEGDGGKSVVLPVDPMWVNANLGSGATDDQIRKALNAVGKNGNKVWQNMALGLDSDDVESKLYLDVPQNVTENLIAVKALAGCGRSTAWPTLRYRLDNDTTGHGMITRGSAQDGSSFNIDIGGDDDPTGVYQIKAVFVDDDGGELAEVPAANQIGILRKAAANKREIVPVPWTKFAAGAEDIAVSNLVKTAGLTAGDKLYVYDDSAKRYATWELQSDKTWKPVKTVKIVNGKLEVQTADSPEVATVNRGSGVWIERHDITKPIHFVGQHDAAPVEVPVEAGTTAMPKWNLVASPLLTDWDLNSVSEGVNVADRIIVPTGKEPRIYTRDATNAKWGYITYEANAKGIVKPVRKEDDTMLKAGTGFWYVSEGGAPTLRWREASEK